MRYGKVVVTELLEQHGILRALLVRCDQLADQVDRGSCDPAALAVEVVRLREALAVHHEAEERVLRPLLRERSVLPERGVEAVVHDHVGEHDHVDRELSDGPTRDLRATLARLRAHLDLEEMTFLGATLSRPR